MRRMMRFVLLAAAAAWIPACGGSSSGGGGGAASSASSAQPTLPPGAPIVAGPGGRTIRSGGGEGLDPAGAGGHSNLIRIWNIAGSDLTVLKEGDVDASFTAPSANPVLGANPRTISGNVVYAIGAASLTSLPAGATTILGDDGVNPATGLHVEAGATLSLPAATDTSAVPDGLYDGLSLTFTHGILIEGEVKVGRRDAAAAGDGLSASAADLAFSATNIVLRSTAVVDASGTDVPGSVGGAGGAMELAGSGVVVSAGTLRSVGGDGDSGGPGGSVFVGSQAFAAYNLADIDVSGGDGAIGAAGAGGEIRIWGSYLGGSSAGGGSYSDGDLTANAGAGATGAGAGGLIEVGATSGGGPSAVRGVLETEGATATGTGAGGAGGQVRVFGPGGEIRMSGSISTRGGTGSGGAGGTGGWVQIKTSYPAHQPIAAGLFLSADIDARGGDGASGGNGGPVEVWTNGNSRMQPEASPVVLVGYASLEAIGGNGGLDGGNGTFVELQLRRASTLDGRVYYGSLYNEVDLVSRGGDGLVGAGGAGGPCAVWATAEPGSDPANLIQEDRQRTIVNKGKADSRGGNGATIGGAGGEFRLIDHYHVRNEGEVLASGGSSGTGTGGTGGTINIRSDGVSHNDADLTSDGGSSTGAGNGGLGGQIFVEAFTAFHRGRIRARGGDSVGGNGGNGRAIEIGSWNGITLSDVGGSLEVRGGAGVTPGSIGIVTVDGIRVALTNGVVGF